MEKQRPESIINELEKKRVVISGGTEGIGKAIAENYLSQSHDVAICARSTDKLSEIKKENPSIKAYQVDLSDRRAAKNFIEGSTKELGGIDTLILNAAVSGVPHKNETEEERKSRLNEIFLVNEVAQVALTRAASEELLENNGKIVFITSGLAQMEKPIPGSEDYAKSKKRIQEWLADFGSRLNNTELNYFFINPGPVDTKMHEEIASFGPDSLAAMSKMAKEKGILRNPDIIGKIIAKMSITGMKYNIESKQYDLKISKGEIVEIAKEAIEHEKSSLDHN